MLSSLFALKMQTRKDQQTIYKVFYARKAYTNENFQIWMNSHSAQLGKITKKKKNVETANSSQNHLWKHILQSIRWAIQWRGIEQ